MCDIKANVKWLPLLEILLCSSSRLHRQKLLSAKLYTLVAHQASLITLLLCHLEEVAFNSQNVCFWCLLFCLSSSSAMLPASIISVDQGTLNCGIMVSRIGGSGDLRRKWESERGRERKSDREREGKRKVLLLFAKLSKRTIEMQEVYILPLKKPNKSNIRFKRK